MEESVKEENIPRPDAGEGQKPPKSKIPKKVLIFGGVVLAIALIVVSTYIISVLKFSDVQNVIDGLVKVLMPFIIGAVIAYLLTPACNHFDKGWMKVFRVKEENGRAAKNIRLVDTFLVLLLFFLAVVVVVAMIIPQLVETAKSVIKLMDQVPTKYHQLIAWLDQVFANNPKILESINSFSSDIYTKVGELVSTYVAPNMTGAIGGIGTGVKSVVSFLQNAFIGFIAAIYMLLGRKRFKEQGKLLVYTIFPDKAAHKVLEEAVYTNFIFSKYISGRIVVSVLVGVLCTIGCLILKIPYCGLMGVIIGVTNMIPLFGVFIGTIPCAFIILVASPIKCLWFVILIVVLQQLEGNIIAPLILGDSTGLNSFWILFALMVFSGLFGFMGLLIGVPIFAVIYHWISEIVFYVLKRRGKQDILLNYLWKFDPKQARYIDERTHEQALADENRPGVEVMKEKLARKKERADRLLRKNHKKEQKES